VKTAAIPDHWEVDSMAQTMAATLAPITLPDADGADVRLGSLWASRPAVLVFLRHYG
jgi:hypothetical protein